MHKIKKLYFYIKSYVYITNYQLPNYFFNLNTYTLITYNIYKMGNFINKYVISITHITFTLY